MKLKSVLVVAALLVGGLAASSSPATAVTGTKLPFSTLAALVVDQAHGRVYLAGDNAKLVTTDLAGTITNPALLTDATALALAPDGSAVAVARSNSRISVLDGATATVTKTYTLPTGCDAVSLAPSSGKVFFTYICETGASAFGTIDVGTQVLTLDVATLSDYYFGRLISVPGAPSVLLTATSSSVTVYDTVGGATPSATVRVTRTGETGDVALTPDGEEFLITAPGSGVVQVFSTTDTAHVGDYDPDHVSQTLAVRSDGTVASGGYGGINFFKPDVATPSSKRAYSSSEVPYTGSIAFGAKVLYVVFRYDGRSWLRTETPGPPAAITIAADRTAYGPGQSAHLTVKLSSPTTSRQVSVYATPAQGTKKLIKSGTVNASGTLAVTAAKLAVNTTFTAEFAGDDDFAASSATRSVKVAAKLTITSTSRSMSSYFHKLPVAPAPTVSVAVNPVQARNSGCLSVLVQRVRYNAWVGQATLSCVHQAGKTGIYKLRMGGQHRGDRLRVKAKVRGLATNPNTESTWYYILFT